MNCPSQAILSITLTLAVSGCTAPGIGPIWPAKNDTVIELDKLDVTEPNATAAASTTPTSPELAALIFDLQTSTSIDPAKRAEMLKVAESLREVDPALLPAILPTVRHRAFDGVPQAPPVSLAQAIEPIAPPAESDISLTPFDSLGKQSIENALFRQTTPVEAKVERAGHTRAMTNVPSNVANVARTPAPRVIENRTITAPTSPSSLNTTNEVSVDSLQSHLAGAIRELESELSDETDSDYQKTLSAKLRFLHLLAGDREQALEPIADASVAEQEFWTKQMYGLSCMLDTAMLSDRSHRLAQAKEHLDLAVVSLGEECNLVVRNLHFITEAEGYGDFTPFEQYQFAAGEDVILYAEIENFGSTQDSQGYTTSLKSRYEIVNSSGTVVTSDEVEKIDRCRNRRQDFFTGLQFRMPANIFPGKYTLRLTIEDRLSQKVGQASIEFDIRGNGN